ncbi:hypothetical protein FHG87_011339 [Trinorchestia longiramus]|nr:hypothetical protein FHG87_011339 [Trinorchestia longiramus]
MIWAAVTATERSPLVFEPCGVKINSVHIFLLFLNQSYNHGLQNISGFTMVSPTGFSTITWLQRNPNVDSEEHSISKDLWPAKSPRPQSLGVFYLVNFEDKSLSYPSHFSRVPQNKTAKGMGSNSTTDTCRL